MQTFIGSISVLGIVTIVGWILYSAFKSDIKQGSDGVGEKDMKTNEYKGTTLINQLVMQILTGSGNVEMAALSLCTFICGIVATARSGVTTATEKMTTAEKKM